MANLKKDIKNMTKFGEDIKFLNKTAEKNSLENQKKYFSGIEWNNITNLKQLPKNMQIKSNDINEDASYAEFICYCDKNKIDKQYIAGLTGFTNAEVEEVIIEAKSLKIYNDLAHNFLKQGKTYDL